MPETMAAPTIPPANSPKGTRFEGALSEADAGLAVRDMFSQIAPRYDLLNHLLSMQLDRVWRRRVARIVRPVLLRDDARVLDLCCGTGDLAFSLRRAPGTRARIIGADFSHAMLVRARAKSSTADSIGVLPVFEADALRMPFADASFDLVTTAFGFRNLANYEAGLREIFRVLRPGGTVAILEFTEPPAGWMGDLYRWYFRNVLPRIGAFLSGDRAAYSYLPASVSRFFRPEELAALMGAVGFASPEYRVWTLGTVALHLGVRPSR
ncbi:MAG TPA: bifunctional demethylmenaquinone methyltransferase/2-methoxy-6-polyprenyl-1,4-benzoquinol methylase UbiE [Candidatus Sulfotelmatobacter sp.]|nr:bifunctional demethylmenaquinone methyltransferase/2-methoxy-6-polyprenyl-1,4-benzoquinol methylase UbiE [Candidatus Sulfotelmatobacter sp.]